MASTRVVEDVVIVGQDFPSETRTLVWKFYDFDGMNHKRDENFTTAPSMCHGVPWSVDIFPRGDKDSDHDEEYVSVCIRNEGAKDVKARYPTVRVGDCVVSSTKKNLMEANKSVGWRNLIPRERAIASMANGYLLVEIDIQVFIDKPQPLLPKGTHSRDMLELLESSKRSDVTFVVGGTVFPAHLCIIHAVAPVLADLAEGADSGEEIVIENVDSCVFKALLRYIYGEEPPPSGMMAKHAREFLDAADRFGCVYLKLLAESSLVELELSNSTAVELLLLADAKSCALLKESALTFIKANAKAVMESPGWESVEKSPLLMTEVMKALAHGISAVTDADNVENMAATTLRRKLQEEDLTEDGTREMLVERLKGHTAKKMRTED